MGQWRHESDAGMTLVEVLASVVVLGLFITVMLSLFAQSSTVVKQTSEKQQALIFAQDALARMSTDGANEVINNPASHGIQLNKTVNGVSYTMLLRNVSSPPEWASNGVYAEVTVSWYSFRGGQKITENVNIDQLFDKN